MTTLTVKVIDGNVDRALRQLKRKMGQHGVIRDMKRHEEALRPGEGRRNKKAKAIKAPAQGTGGRVAPKP
jgi:ribosomal protein S21